MDDKTIQRALQAKGFYDDAIDGVLGMESREAIEKWLRSVDVDPTGWTPNRLRTGAVQLVLKDLGFDPGTIDGWVGPSTQYALERWQDKMRGVKGPRERGESRVWPVQAQVPAFYGEVGQNQTMLELPFQMRLAWDLGTVVKRISVHEKVHDSAKRVFGQVLDHYGGEKIRNLKLDLFGGSLNVRKMRGSNRWSMHAWGIAIDFNPDNNQLRWDHTKATMAGPAYVKFWELWEAEGWVSLGRTRNYDWMHVQAARL